VVSALSVRLRKLRNVGQSLDGWQNTYNLELLRASEGRDVKLLVLAVFSVVITQQSALGIRGGFLSVLLMCNP
jgi:hypothetical protein